MAQEQGKLRACVMGWPISHSLSPVLHGHWLKQYGINGEYLPMAIMPDRLRAALDMLVERGYRGCNLTMPLKELALPMMDAHDESCLMSGAVNTVVVRNGKLHGYNSDGFGFVESLESQCPGYGARRVVVLGTGGAARGIIASLRGAGAGTFVLVNRTREKAERVVKQFTLDAEIRDWGDRGEALAGADLVVNCTSLGMEGEPPLDLALEKLPRDAVVADIVYRPRITPLLERAKARGNRIAEGLPMLLHQGRLGFGHWFGKDPEVTPALYEAVSAAAG